MSALADITTEELIDNFAFLGDWQERYRYIIDLGRKLPPMSDEDKTEENRVRGCQSTVWLKATVRDTNPAVIEFTADSDAHIVRGLIAILSIVYSGKSRAEIATIDINRVFERLELMSHLSPTRSNGLFAMVRRIEALAATD